MKLPSAMRRAKRALNSFEGPYEHASSSEAYPIHRHTFGSAPKRGQRPSGMHFGRAGKTADAGRGGQRQKINGGHTKGEAKFCAKRKGFESDHPAHSSCSDNTAHPGCSEWPAQHRYRRGSALKAAAKLKVFWVRSITAPRHVARSSAIAILGTADMPAAHGEATNRRFR